MDDVPSINPEYDLWLLLIRAQRVTYKAREKELSRYGLSPEQSAILNITQASGGRVTMAEISRLMFRERHSINGLVTRMEEKGLVKKVRDQRRKNIVRVALTEKGERAFQQSTRRESIHRIMSRLTEEQRRQLGSVLPSLIESSLEELDRYYRQPFSRPSGRAEPGA